MIGLLDLPEHDRQVLLQVVAGHLAWFPEAPRAWGPVGVRPAGSVWAWLDGVRDPLAIATREQVDAVYRLQRVGLLTPVRPRLPIRPTRAGAWMADCLQDITGWQPFDRVLPPARKPSPRPRKKRAS